MRTRLAHRISARRKPVVLVASGLGPQSACALRRASALARIFGARIVVLHVIEVDVARSRFAGAHQELAERRRAAAGAVFALCRENGLPRATEIDVRVGRLVPSILDAAFARRPALLVVGAAPAKSVPERLLRDVECPLWVARPPRSNDAIVAATDLANDTYPVLRRAVDLGARFDVPVTFVSNADDASEDDVIEREALLRGVARALGHGVEAQLLREPRPVDAILQVARARDADLVVVGVRTRSPRLGTAVAVVSESLRSVLAVPLGTKDVA